MFGGPSLNRRDRGLIEATWFPKGNVWREQAQGKRLTRRGLLDGRGSAGMPRGGDLFTFPESPTPTAGPFQAG